MIRTFIAVETSPSVRQKAAELIDACRQAGLEAKWVSTDNMHITLQFLGNVRETEVASICRAVSRAVEKKDRDGHLVHSPFDVTCRGVGAFPSIQRPRVIWLGMQEGREELIALQAGVEAALRDIGYRGEARRFEPHLTIGRVRNASGSHGSLTQFLAAHQDFDGSAFDVSEVLVFSSQLEKEGPRYEVLGRAELPG